MLSNTKSKYYSRQNQFLKKTIFTFTENAIVTKPIIKITINFSYHTVILLPPKAYFLLNILVKICIFYCFINKYMECYYSGVKPEMCIYIL